MKTSIISGGSAQSERRSRSLSAELRVSPTQRSRRDNRTEDHHWPRKSHRSRPQDIAAGASRNVSALTTVDTVIAIATSAKNKGFMSIRFEQAMVESDAVQDTHWALNRQLPPKMLSTTTRVFLADGNC
ncbi:MAG: hypothetical protein NTY42_05015 [Planctomycetota bacterium]|nr:hypothetical protein [Planctomycetota bacterium]